MRARAGTSAEKEIAMTETVGAIDAWATLVLPGTIDRWPPEFISILDVTARCRFSSAA